MSTTHHMRLTNTVLSIPTICNKVKFDWLALIKHSEWLATIIHCFDYRTFHACIPNLTHYNILYKILYLGACDWDAYSLSNVTIASSGFRAWVCSCSLSVCTDLINLYGDARKQVALTACEHKFRLLLAEMSRGYCYQWTVMHDRRGYRVINYHCTSIAELTQSIQSI